MNLTVVRVIVPLLILGAAVGASRWIGQQTPAAERKPAEQPAPVVETRRLTASAKRAVIEATGIVAPAERVVLIPQVTGKVVHISKSMVPGGQVKRGEVLVRIDPQDYRLAVQQQVGNLRNAELAVEQEEAQAELARHEWTLVGAGGKAPPLFSRDSQRAAAEANLAAGKRELDRAKLNLSRTTLTAPFDATVVSESIDVGQVVGPQSQLAELIGVGEMWVMVSVPVEELDLIQIPGVNAEQGSPARVKQRLAHGKGITRNGRVTRLVGQLDQRTRRAQVVVTIDDPPNTPSGLPLLAGAHVDVALEGKPFSHVYTLPREAVYEGDTAWVMNQDRRLVKHSVDIAWGDSQQVYATGGVQDGDQLVLTRITSAIPGMLVKPLSAGESEKQEPPAAPAKAAPNTPTPTSEAKPGANRVDR